MLAFGRVGNKHPKALPSINQDSHFPDSERRSILEQELRT